LCGMLDCFITEAMAGTRVRWMSPVCAFIPGIDLITYRNPVCAS
jgi:hypothetical protein